MFVNKTAETLDMSGNPKIGNPQDTVETLGNSGSMKITLPDTATNQNAETLGTSGTAISAVRQENNKTSVMRETLALFG